MSLLLTIKIVAPYSLLRLTASYTVGMCAAVFGVCISFLSFQVSITLIGAPGWFAKPLAGYVELLALAHVAS
jgi:hypothetical protein